MEGTQLPPEPELEPPLDELPLDEPLLELPPDELLVPSDGLLLAVQLAVPLLTPVNSYHWPRLLS